MQILLQDPCIFLRPLLVSMFSRGGAVCVFNFIFLLKVNYNGTKTSFGGRDPGVKSKSLINIYVHSTVLLQKG